MISILWRAATLLIGLGTLGAAALAAPRQLSLAGGRIAAEVHLPAEENPERVTRLLTIAANAAVDHVGPLPEGARLTIHLEPPPSCWQRLKAGFWTPPAHGQQEQNEIRLTTDADPLKLGFRLGHELTHWIIEQKYSRRPPLWLEEGLAQVVGAATAESCGRVFQMNFSRPPPPDLAAHTFSLEELTRLSAYPRSPTRAAAFYWQAEALVRDLREQLGPQIFAEYLGMLSAPESPHWQPPLLEKWYFSGADFDRLRRRIQPPPPAPP